MTRSQMLKLMHKLNKVYILLNKYIYVLPLFSLVSTMISKIPFLRNNKLLKVVNVFIKIFILVNIIIGVSVILYFTDFTTPVNTTFSIYNDLLEPYLEMVRHLWDIDKVNLESLL